MRNASAALKALLIATTEFVVCDLLTIKLPSGAILRYTSADLDLTVFSLYDNASHLFSSSGPPFTRGETKLVRGLQIGTLALTINGRQGIDTVAGVSWPQAAATGLLDGALVCLEKVIAPSFADMSAGTLIQFLGRIGVATPSRNAVELEVRSPIDQLAGQFPRHVYQPTCVHTVYDAGCALARGVYSVGGTVLTGSTKNVINCTNANPSAYYDLGTIVFTSGPNSGVTRGIRAYTLGTPSVASLLVNLPTTPTIGDAFTITAGCDKTFATCQAKFGNLAHFRGYPFIPKAEVAR